MTQPPLWQTVKPTPNIKFNTGRQLTNYLKVLSSSAVITFPLAARCCFITGLFKTMQSAVFQRARDRERQWGSTNGEDKNRIVHKSGSRSNTCCLTRLWGVARAIPSRNVWRFRWYRVCHKNPSICYRHYGELSKKQESCVQLKRRVTVCSGLPWIKDAQSERERREEIPFVKVTTTSSCQTAMLQRPLPSFKLGSTTLTGRCADYWPLPSNSVSSSLWSPQFVCVC